MVFDVQVLMNAESSPRLQNIDSDSNLSSALVTQSNSLPPPEDINLDSSDMLPVDDDLNLEDLMRQKVSQPSSIAVKLATPFCSLQ